MTIISANVGLYSRIYGGSSSANYDAIIKIACNYLIINWHVEPLILSGRSRTLKGGEGRMNLTTILTKMFY